MLSAGKCMAAMMAGPVGQGVSQRRCPWGRKVPADPGVVAPRLRERQKRHQPRTGTAGCSDMGRSGDHRYRCAVVSVRCRTQRSGWWRREPLQSPPRAGFVASGCGAEGLPPFPIPSPTTAENKKGHHLGWPKCLIYLVFMVPVTGVELVTFALRMRCSTN